MSNEPSITLAALQAILDRETSVIAPEDVWLLMDLARQVAGTPPTVADRVTDWNVTATAERFGLSRRDGIQAWKVTLTHDGASKIKLTVLTALGAGEPSAADGLREVRHNAITYGRIDRALDGTGTGNPEAEQYDRVMAWLGEPRFDALVYDTAE